MGSIKDKVAIIGMGCSKFGERWDCGIEDLIIESAYETYDDAGIKPSDIEAVFYANGFQGGVGGSAVADALKLRDIPILHNENFCPSGHIALIEACMAVASGAYDVVMAIGAEKLKDTGYAGLGTGRGTSPVLEARRTAPSSFAMIANRYFEDHGISYDDGKRLLAKIAVKNHANGMLSPKAHFHKAITVEDVMKAAIISTPYGLYDCCGNSDGSAACIVTRSDFAEKYRNDPIYVKGFGVSMDCVLPHMRPGFEWDSFSALRTSSQKAYEMAGITNPREQIDIAEVHDCFTGTELCIYEDFGFSPRGGAPKDIEDGFFERTGGLPVNVDGGLKCFGHPTGASGIRMTYEVYKQLQRRVDNPARQLEKADVGLSHTFGGPPQLSAVLILGKELGDIR